MEFLMKVSKTTIKKMKLMLPQHLMKNLTKFVTLHFPNRINLTVRLFSCELGEKVNIWLDVSELVKHRYIRENYILRFKHLVSSHFKVSIFDGFYDYCPEIKYPNPNNEQTSVRSREDDEETNNDCDYDDKDSANSPPRQRKTYNKKKNVDNGPTGNKSRHIRVASETLAQKKKLKRKNKKPNMMENEGQDLIDESERTCPRKKPRTIHDERWPDLKCKSKKSMMKKKMEDHSDDHESERMAASPKKRPIMRKGETSSRNRRFSKRNLIGFSTFEDGQEVEVTESDGNASAPCEQENKIYAARDFNKILSSFPGSKRAAEEAELSKPQNPAIKLIIQKSNRRCVNMPASFSNKYLHRYSRGLVKIQMFDKKHGQKDWSLRPYWRGRGGMILTEGWSKFCRDNNLRLGDVCLFELMDSNPVVFEAATFYADKDSAVQA